MNSYNILENLQYLYNLYNVINIGINIRPMKLILLITLHNKLEFYQYLISSEHNNLISMTYNIIQNGLIKIMICKIIIHSRIKELKAKRSLKICLNTCKMINNSLIRIQNKHCKRYKSKWIGNKKVLLVKKHLLFIVIVSLKILNLAVSKLAVTGHLPLGLEYNKLYNKTIRICKRMLNKNEFVEQ